MENIKIHRLKFFPEKSYELAPYKLAQHPCRILRNNTTLSLTCRPLGTTMATTASKPSGKAAAFSTTTEIQTTTTMPVMTGLQATKPVFDPTRLFLDETWRRLKNFGRMLDRKIENFNVLNFISQKQNQRSFSFCYLCHTESALDDYIQNNLHRGS